MVRRLLGPRAALLWARETQALGELLYYALTTGRGTQTLGEEYCDILQATGRLGAPPGAAQRGMLVLLQSLGPYLAERLAAPQPDDSFAAWQAERWQQQQQQQQQGQQSEGAAAQARWLLLWVRVRAAAQQLRERAEATAQPLVLRCAGPAAFVRDHWASLLRLQLALFYLYGNYYQLPKRLTGGCCRCWHYVGMYLQFLLLMPNQLIDSSVPCVLVFPHRGAVLVPGPDV